MLMQSYNAHVIRFYAPEPKAVHNAALDDERRFLALSRSDGSLELWHVAGAITTLSQSRKAWANCAGGAPACLCRLPSPPSEGGDSVEALVWCGSRLYSAGLHGHVVRRHGSSLRPISATCAAGSALWSLAVDGPRRRLACGSEDGCVSVYQCADDTPEGDREVVFCKRLAKQERRVLCICWSEDGRHLATGSVNTVSVYNTDNGRLLSQLSIGRNAIDRRDSLVWTVLLFNDLTVVTGDSRGQVCFWDGRLGALRQSVRTHGADVLTISGDSNALCVAGVEPSVVELRRMCPAATDLPSAAGWVKTTRSACHTRDVRVVIAGDLWRVSAGVDTDLVFGYRDGCNRTIRTSRAPQTENIVPLSDLPGFAINTGLSLQLWRLPTPSVGVPEKLVELQYRGGQQPVGFTVSADACWIAYSTPGCWLRVLHVDVHAPRAALQPIRHLPPRQGVTLHCLRFSAGSNGRCRRLHALSSDGELVTISVSERQHEEEEEEGCPVLTRASCLPDSWPHLLECSRDGEYVAVAWLDGSVSLHSACSRDPLTIVPPAPSSSPVTAISFRQHDGVCLVLVHADRRLVEYSLQEPGHALVTEWSRATASLPPAWLQRRHCVTRVSVGREKLLLHDNTAILALPLSLPPIPSDAPPNKKRRHNKRQVKDQPSPATLVTDRYRHLMCAAFVNPTSAEKKEELFILEASPEAVDLSLPPPFYRKKYGLG